MSTSDPTRSSGVPRSALFLLWFLPVLAVAVALTVKGHPGYAAVLVTGELSMSAVIALATRRPTPPPTRAPAPAGPGAAASRADDRGPVEDEPALPRLVGRPATATRPWVVAVAILGIFAVIVLIAVLGSRAG